jgi:uncharacterized RDD family membrane protein YckC
MKCPKCDYLGFETGDRCKNCGYDFSLAAPEPPQNDLMLRAPQRDADRWLTQLEARLDNVRPSAMAAPVADPLGPMSLAAPAEMPPSPAPAVPDAPPTVAPQVRTLSKSTPALPLFHPGGTDWDEPLIKVPSAPRPPLAVRRTPDRPKLRTTPKATRRILPDANPDGVLEFSENPAPTVASRPSLRPAPGVDSPVAAVIGASDVSGAGRRMVAAALDQLILLSVDGVVIYFTFQIAGLPFSGWQAVPLLPLVLFLLMVKASYFSVFTALGGQTVGKMATGIRVVGEDNQDINPSRAVQRTLAALASVATVGLGYAPVLLGGDRRALHDRVAGTRVVGPLHQ